MKRDVCVAVGAIAVWSGVFLLAEDAACGYAHVGIQWVCHRASSLLWTLCCCFSILQSLRNVPPPVSCLSLPEHLPKNQVGKQLPRKTDLQKLSRAFQ